MNQSRLWPVRLRHVVRCQKVVIHRTIGFVHMAEGVAVVVRVGKGPVKVVSRIDRSGVAISARI